MRWLRKTLHALHTKTPLYQMHLNVTPPDVLLSFPPAPWSGTSRLGHDMTQGVFTYFQQSQPLPSVWMTSYSEGAFFNYLHGFEWGYHLREVGGRVARRLMRSLVESWLDLFGLSKYDPYVWSGPVLSRRLIHMMGLYEFYGASADDVFRFYVAYAVKRQYTHLCRLVKVNATVEPSLLIAAVMAGLSLREPHQRVEEHMYMLNQILRTRETCYRLAQNPIDQLSLFMDLLYLRRCLYFCKKALPSHLQWAIHKLAAGLHMRLVRPHHLLDARLTPFQLAGLNAGLEKMKFTPPSPFVSKKEAFVMAHVGKSTLHAYGKQHMVCLLCAAGVPLVYVYAHVSGVHKSQFLPFFFQPSEEKNMRLLDLSCCVEGKHLSLQHDVAFHGSVPYVHRRRLYMKEDLADVRVHETLVGSGVVHFSLQCAAQITHVALLEKKGTALMASARMGTWVLKTIGVENLQMATSATHTIIGSKQLYYGLYFSAPCHTQGCCIKWGMSLIQ